MLKQVNGSLLRKMIVAGASLLEQNKRYVDSLNVFPVPDGDTGTNMCLTYKSTIKEIDDVPTNNIDAISEAFAKGALKGARGNSGVILSQIFKGMSMVLSQCTEHITTKIFAKSLVSGAEMAYKAVTKPKEGTMLTVIRVMGEAAVELAKKHSDFETFFNKLLDAGEDILQQTPEMLPVLKKAGVVDSGGRGIIVIFTGFHKVVLGEEIKYEPNNDVAVEYESNDDIINLDDLGDIEFAYCTEFMVINMHKSTTSSDIDKLRGRLMDIGDSVICIGDLSLVKVHVHTNTPNIALGYALELGELNNLKIENMLAQNRQMKEDRAKNQEQKPYAIVAVAAGEGLNNIFKDITVDYVISGGQTMNPSADDIAKACERVPSNNVFVLPNNKNIILSSEQARALTKKNLLVVPTTSIPEGIAAILALNPDDTLEENLKNMTISTKNVKSGSITYAVRETEINGFKLKEGDIIGLDDKHILTKDKTPNESAVKLVGKLKDENTSIVTMFYGEGVKEEEAEQLVETLTKKYADIEFSVLYGGQPVYYYILSVE